MQRFEILDWYHLKEHLYNVSGSLRRLAKAEDWLWQGNVEQAVVLFAGCKFKRAINFLAYLRNHRHRMPEYGYLQKQGLTIGSGGALNRRLSRLVVASRFLALSGISPMLLKF
ncbi:hypothetical protein HC246_19775 [Pseudanabaena yagii GIHE-NHR1]|uniref:Transposase n=1 Tax=Pseudanabaena yagii GIHE-NHR1 TaxID=2722753 RepID=A0ABX1LZ24_9CYAN|nr:hypothetical protein [Pseudanabaena yagii GIHE-NHR1]